MKKKKKIGLSLNKFTVSSLTNLSKEKIIGAGCNYSTPTGGCTGGTTAYCTGTNTNTCIVHCNPTTSFTCFC